MSSDTQLFLLIILSIAWPYGMGRVYAKYGRSSRLLGLMAIIPFVALFIAGRLDQEWVAKADSVEGEIVEYTGNMAHSDNKPRHMYKVAYQHHDIAYSYAIMSRTTLQVGESVTLLVDPDNSNRVRKKSDEGASVGWMFWAFTTVIAAGYIFRRDFFP